MNETATKQDLVNLSQDFSRLILENNVLLVNMVDKMMYKKIKANNDVLIPLMGDMIDEKIKENNDVLIPLIDKKIKENNDVLIPLIDKKIKENNEYIFEHFNDQTDRILNLFKGVVRVRADGTLGAYV